LREEKKNKARKAAKSAAAESDTERTTISLRIGRELPQLRLGEKKIRGGSQELQKYLMRNFISKR
jgi:hypothetical protein